MIINQICTTGFQAKQKIAQKPQNLHEKLSTTPRNNDEANEYFLNVDGICQALPCNWDAIYKLSEEKKIILADYLKASYLTKTYYDYEEVLNPQELSPKLKKLLTTDNILNKKEIKRFLEKTQGAYNPKDILSPSSLLLSKFNEDNILQSNLAFIKTLLKEENNDVFNAMSSVTATKILFNKFLTYDDFINSLNALRKNDALSVSSTKSLVTLHEIICHQRRVIHEYLLGESYIKIYDADEKFDRTIY